MKISFLDLLGGAGAPSSPSLPLAAAAARAGLPGLGFEPAPADRAEVLLVEALDHPDWDGPDLVPADLEASLVVRVHAGTVDGAPSAPLGALLARADRVVVSTRSHLVRLGSAGVLEAERTVLLAPAGPEVRAQEEAGEQDSVLVLAPEAPTALSEAARALRVAVSLLDLTASAEAAAQHLQGVASRHGAVVLTEHGQADDGVVAGLCERLARPLVAPFDRETSSRSGCFHVADASDAEAWTGALRAALEAPRPAAEPARDARRLERLAEVLRDASAGRTDCDSVPAA